MDTLVLRRLDDMHLHLRNGNLLTEVAPLTAKYAGRAVVMPNLRPRAILTGADVVWYRNEIKQALKGLTESCPFEPLMTIEIRDNTTPDMVVSAHKAGAVAGKVYPLGVTTNSEEGLRNFFRKEILDTFRAMRDSGMILLLHGELDLERTLVVEREAAFLPVFLKLVEKIPDLKIVLEHVSTKVGVNYVKQLYDNVAATITAHHLRLTLNDVIGYGVQPHHACMPMPKGFGDRDALVEAATSGNPKFFLGSDSAPHIREKKECAKGACGVYTAPVLPQVLAEIFEDAGSLDRLEDFVSYNGAKFYGLPLNQGTFTLVKRDWLVPGQVGSVVPFCAGTRLKWQLA